MLLRDQADQMTHRSRGPIPVQYDILTLSRFRLQVVLKPYARNPIESNKPHITLIGTLKPPFQGSCRPLKLVKHATPLGKEVMASSQYASTHPQPSTLNPKPSTLDPKPFRNYHPRSLVLTLVITLNWILVEEFP